MSPQEDLVDVTVFVVGLILYKATLRLPRWSSHTTEAVAEVAKEQSTRELPSLPLGSFEVVCSSSADHLVAIFLCCAPPPSPHDIAELVSARGTGSPCTGLGGNPGGCSTTNTHQHRKLLWPHERHKKIENFTIEPNNIRLRFQYIYGYDHTYCVEDHSILLSLCSSFGRAAEERT